MKPFTYSPSRHVDVWLPCGSFRHSEAKTGFLTGFARREQKVQGLSESSSLRSKVRIPIPGPICLAYGYREVSRQFEQFGREPTAEATVGFPPLGLYDASPGGP